MTKTITLKFFIFTAVVLSSSFAAFGQEPRPSDVRQADGFRPAGPPPAAQRPNLVDALGLAPEQVRELRRLNQERKPVEEAARTRFQDAQRALNVAIYADNVNEAEVRTRLAEFQAAQGELAKIKFMNELAIRKLLTPEQLGRFRDLRRRFGEAREAGQDGPRRLPRRQMQRMPRQNLPVN